MNLNQMSLLMLEVGGQGWRVRGRRKGCRLGHESNMSIIILYSVETVTYKQKDFKIITTNASN